VLTRRAVADAACLILAISVLFARGVVPTGSAADDFVTGSGHPTRGDILTVHYFERPPYMLSTPEGMRGLTAGLADSALRLTGLAYRWENTPSRRHLDIIRGNTGNDCGVGWFRNPDREEFARFSVPIYRDQPAIALARADNGALFDGEMLARALANTDLTLLVKDGFSYGPYVDSLILAYHPPTHVSTGDNLGMLKMIAAGRADYFFMAREEAEYLIAQSGLPADDFRIVTFSDMPAGDERFVLFSMRTPDTIVERFNAAIGTLRPVARTDQK